jgi:cadmium resistance protein CadD (predicted permease)
VIPALRLLPLLPGIRAAWSTWRQRRFGDHDEELEHETSAGTRIPPVAAVTFANSGEQHRRLRAGVCHSRCRRRGALRGVFLVGVAVWCAAGRFFSTRPMIAKAIAR